MAINIPKHTVLWNPKLLLMGFITKNSQESQEWPKGKEKVKVDKCWNKPTYKLICTHEVILFSGYKKRAESVSWHSCAYYGKDD